MKDLYRRGVGSCMHTTCWNFKQITISDSQKDKSPTVWINTKYEKSEKKLQK